MMNEDVLAAVIRGDEAVAFALVEPLYSSSVHGNDLIAGIHEVTCSGSPRESAAGVFSMESGRKSRSMTGSTTAS
jgi:hypothetical protein